MANRKEFVKYKEVLAQQTKTEGYSSYYKGLLACLIRDVPSYGVYFWTYNALKNKFNLNEDNQRS